MLKRDSFAISGTTLPLVAWGEFADVQYGDQFTNGHQEVIPSGTEVFEVTQAQLELLSYDANVGLIVEPDLFQVHSSQARFLGLPTSDPGGTNHLWNSNNNLVLSGYTDTGSVTGTWEPTVANFSDASGNDGTYTKTGDVVVLRGNARPSSTSGTIRIQNLPFSANNNYYGNYFGLDIDGDNQLGVCRVTGNPATITVHNATGGSLVGSDFSTGSTVGTDVGIIRFSITYRTDD